MRKILNGLVMAFLMAFFNLATPIVTALIIARGFTTPSSQALDIDMSYQISKVPVIKQIDVSKGAVRKVTAYNVGDPKQTHSKPCIGASGENLCNLVETGFNVCAANFVPLRSKLHVDKV